MLTITIEDLELIVGRLNKITCSPAASYTRVNGKLVQSIGHYYLDDSCGCIKLVRIGKDGEREIVSRNLYGTKRQLYMWIEAFIAGFQSKLAA